MKRSGKLLLVSMLLALAFTVAKATTAPTIPPAPDSGITICCDVPPIDNI